MDNKVQFPYCIGAHSSCSMYSVSQFLCDFQELTPKRIAFCLTSDCLRNELLLPNDYIEGRPLMMRMIPNSSFSLDKYNSRRSFNNIQTRKANYWRSRIDGGGKILNSNFDHFHRQIIATTPIKPIPTYRGVDEPSKCVVRLRNPKNQLCGIPGEETDIESGCN